MRVLVAQVNPVACDVKANLTHLERIVRESGQPGDVIVLPETWSTGYDLRKAVAFAEENEAAISSLQALAATHQVALIGSMIMPNHDGPLMRNQAIAIGRDGSVLNRYDKSHLIDVYAEKEIFQPGRELLDFQLDEFRAALTICYDLRFPELYRFHFLRGVEMFFVVAEWPAIRREHWRTLVQARAIENQAFVVACCRVGSDESVTYAGTSLIVSPWGEIMAEASPDTEALLSLELGRDAVESARKRLPVIQDVWLAPQPVASEMNRVLN